MADPAKRLPANVAGDFFVDATCINCDTCRQLAPETFVEEGEYSSVHHQPADGPEVLRATQALLACPVGSIGTSAPDRTVLASARGSFPLRLDGEVYYNGFNSAKSFGANSYFVRHPAGNWLIDSPRYLRPLVEAFERMGGVRYVFLTHEDDVADADRYAGRFGATRIIHREDREAQPEAEWVVEGNDPVAAGAEFLILPVPGHTAGSLALLHRSRYLFSGDHLWWDRERASLGVPARLVRSKTALRDSTRRLLAHPFEWLLPGHGDRVHLPAARMQEELRRFLAGRFQVVC